MDLIKILSAAFKLFVILNSISCYSQLNNSQKLYDIVDMNEDQYKISWMSQGSIHFSDSTFKILPNGKVWPIVETKTLLVLYQSTGNPANFIYIILLKNGKQLFLNDMINIDPKEGLVSVWSKHKNTIEIYDLENLSMIKEIIDVSCAEPIFICIDTNKSYFKNREYHIVLSGREVKEIIKKF